MWCADADVVLFSVLFDTVGEPGMWCFLLRIGTILYRVFGNGRSVVASWLVA